MYADHLCIIDGYLKIRRYKESLEGLREWSIQESGFQIGALETINRVNLKRHENRITSGNQHIFFWKDISSIRANN